VAAVEPVADAAVVHQGDVVDLLDVAASLHEEDRSAAVVVAVVAAVVSPEAVVVVDSLLVGEVDTKRIPDRFTFTTNSPGRAVFPCRSISLELTNTNRYHEHSTAFGSSMGFLVHVEHGAVLENAQEHCVRKNSSHFMFN
jgi:hypothetical protein